jgi:N-methylhydantoinase B
VPGSFNTNARDSYGEGVVVPPTKIVEDGVLRRDVVRLLMRNLRDAPTAYGDLMAQIGGCRIGEARLQELMQKYGKDTIVAQMDALMDYSERHLREEFANVPDGTYSWTAYIDGDPGTSVDEPLPVHLDMTIAGNRATYDFSKSAEQAKGAINATIASSVTAAWVATKLIFPHVPLNQGIYRAIDFILPTRSVLTAEYPAPVSGMASTVFPAVTDCVLACFMQVVPERCMAGPTGHTNSVIGGWDPRPGRERPFVVYLWQEGGWGARVAHKDNHTTMASYAAGAKNQPIELVELYFPLLFERYEYRQDSAGAGYHRGGFGVSKGWSLTDGEALLSVLGDGEDFAPWGWAGGKDGANCIYLMDPDTEQEGRISLFTAGRQIEAGQTMRIHREGGGGYGDPLSRPIEWVLADVADELVTVEAAQRDYGVVITSVDPVTRDCVVDEASTGRLRAGAVPPDTQVN